MVCVCGGGGGGGGGGRETSVQLHLLILAWIIPPQLGTQTQSSVTLIFCNIVPVRHRSNSSTVSIAQISVVAS